MAPSIVTLITTKMSERQKKARLRIKIFTGLLIVQAIFLLVFLAERDFHISYTETNSQSHAFLTLIGQLFGVLGSMAFIISGRQDLKKAC